MPTRRPPIHPLAALASLATVGLCLCGAGAPGEVRGDNPLITLQNDSLVNGGQVAIQFGFADFEIGAATFFPHPDLFPIKIREIHIFWKSLLGGAEPTVEEAIHIYIGGIPGGTGFTEIGLLESPQMLEGGFNVYDVTALNVMINNPTPLTIGLELFDGPGDDPFDIFRASLATDTNECDAGTSYVRDNTAFAWTDLCDFGASGNLLIRCVVESLAVPDPCVGDMNGDDVVNTADLGLLLAVFGQMNPPAVPLADINGDGVVNTADLGLFLNEFGTDCTL